MLKPRHSASPLSSNTLSPPKFIDNKTLQQPRNFSTDSGKSSPMTNQSKASLFYSKTSPPVHLQPATWPAAINARANSTKAQPKTTQHDISTRMYHTMIQKTTSCIPSWRFPKISQWPVTKCFLTLFIQLQTCWDLWLQKHQNYQIYLFTSLCVYWPDCKITKLDWC